MILIFIFAVSGKELFSESYISFYGDNATEINQMPRMPRWNFADFYSSFMTVFRVMCGEWIEPMWDCLEATKGWSCIPFFLCTKILGNFVVNTYLFLYRLFFYY